jgi:hypothetical protein
MFNKKLHHIYSTVLCLFNLLIMETTNHINKTICKMVAATYVISFPIIIEKKQGLA